MRKISDKSKLRGILQCQTSIPQNCQGHHKQGKSEKLSQFSEAQGGMTPNCVGSSMGSRLEKGHGVKTK